MDPLATTSSTGVVAAVTQVPPAVAGMAQVVGTSMPTISQVRIAATFEMNYSVIYILMNFKVFKEAVFFDEKKDINRAQMLRWGT